MATSVQSVQSVQSVTCRSWSMMASDDGLASVGLRPWQRPGGGMTRWYVPGTRIWLDRDRAEWGGIGVTVAQLVSVASAVEDALEADHELASMPADMLAACR